MVIEIECIPLSVVQVAVWSAEEEREVGGPQVGHWLKRKKIMVIMSLAASVNLSMMMAI